MVVVRDLIFPILAGLAVIFMIASGGARINKAISDSVFLKKCEQKQEFILDRTVVKCEIVKDLR
jgi:hypothetical protein